MSHPLAGTVYTTPPIPTSCTVCKKGERHLRLLYSIHGDYECSHLECPHRKAAASYKPTHGGYPGEARTSSTPDGDRWLQTR